ncbi:MAG: substrate-binding domain-containing protein, partial [Planctomycetes bacterium]|nr:substrate-binding domain-containing protein [Planctomycetota bacterium]
WDTTCAQFEGMEFVSDPTLTGLSQRVALGIAASTRQPSSALLLARWLQAPERGGGIYTKHAFQRTANGDAWNPRVELVVYAGSMFHAALEDVFQRFEEREGVRVTRIYNGCGILVAQMRGGGEPDAYFSCDSSFLDDIEERFGKRQELSVNPLVLIVPAGNPKGIQGLADLSQAGLDVGLAHPTQSALGRLTQNHLKKLGLWDKIQTSGNVKQDAPQGDFLVNALLTGSLDVALVYASNASLVRESLSVIPLDEGIAAHQPFAIAKDSSHPHLSQRLFDAVLEERERFENLGFRWAHRP